MRVRIFLRQALFTLPGSLAHLPAATAVIEGTCADPAPAGLRVAVERYLDDRGRELEGPKHDLLLPGAKIDHVIILSP